MKRNVANVTDGQLMIAIINPIGRTRRLIVWLKSPVRNKIYSVLVRFFSAANKFDNELIRSARFEALDPQQEFSMSAHGSENFVVINADNTISKILYVKGSFDFDKVEKAISILKGANHNFSLHTLIDIGANVGTVCIPAVKRGLATNAIAIEPESRNYRVLVANVFLNDLADKIHTYNLALGCENNQTLEFELSPFNSGDHRVRVSDGPGNDFEASREMTFVKSETFDRIVPSVDKNSCLIWMDTQGYEGIILQGALKATRAQVPMVIEFWPGGMKRMNSFPALKDAILNYSEYYDLSEENPRRVKITPSTVDDLYERLDDGDHWTDVLLV